MGTALTILVLLSLSVFLVRVAAVSLRHKRRRCKQVIGVVDSESLASSRFSWKQRLLSN